MAWGFWCGALAAVLLTAISPWLKFPRTPDQHLYIIRHGDKMSKYPPCNGTEGKASDLCYDDAQFGNNPELSDCGHRQSAWVARYLAHKGIRIVVSSPYVRALQTAVPLAESQGLRIRVDESISEDRQSSGPFRMRNTAGSTTEWARVLALWDPEYSAPPIQTPEGHEQYWTRIERAVQALAERIPPASGNAALFTHATPALSLGYGLCRNLFASLQDFVEQQPIGIAACGIVHVVRDGRTGFCKELHPVDNSAFQALECGRTTYSLKRYSARPGKYWRPPELAMQKELEGAYGSEE
mmetsp:Transcript_84205/g.140653  ORF Transcript_84205/g.140653 Transcript_84205/m.140653 type:complete len:297 (-) Transcript_84205:111-1001(-)